MIYYVCIICFFKNFKYFCDMNQLKEQLDLIELKSPGAKPLLIAIRGSRAYGTNTPTSDTDYAGVYIQSHEDILGFNYKEQINDTKNDTVFYEVKRFLELVGTNNPNILELLNTPENCILYKDPAFDEILKHKDSFITKSCSKSFGGYAIQQIKKAKGQNKKQNWEQERVIRKSPIDFCYLHVNNNSIPLSTWFDNNKLNQKFAGLTKVPHSRDTYALYYDHLSDSLYSDKKSKFSKWVAKGLSFLFGSEPMGFKGVGFEESNSIRLSSIPKDVPKHYFVGYVSYNEDGYTQHCKEYNSYLGWLEERNEQRWVDVKSHGQKIDGKNMMHCRRLLEMAKEIAEGKGINVFRNNFKYLLSIRMGEVDLQTLIDKAENDILEIDKLFSNSSLPDKVDNELLNNILVKLRKEIYNL